MFPHERIVCLTEETVETLYHCGSTCTNEHERISALKLPIYPCAMSG